MLHTTGVPESELAQLIADIEAERPAGADLAFLPGVAGVSLRLTARGIEDPAHADMVLDQAEAIIAPVVSSYRFHAEGGDLVDAVAEALTQRGKTVATAESCTGGGVAKRLTDRAGSSAYFLGGVVSYTNEAKVSILGVDAAVIEDHGAVSREVAVGMAQGARERFVADAGIGITGVAGPSGGTDTKPVGTVWYAVSLDDRTAAREERFPGDRAFVRARAGQAALMLLLRMLEGSA
jgi:nicotinamide-nucleotide amidase